MPMQFEPTDQRIAFAKFQFIRFRQTTKTGAKPVFVAVAGEREKSKATDASGIGCSFHDCSDERFNVVQPAKDSRKSQELKCMRPTREGSRRRVAPARRFRRNCRCFAQIPVLLR